MIENAVEEGSLYLFQIYNKDYSKNKSKESKGTPNLHTLYWESLFSPDNLKDVVYKLNGDAEIFYRKSSIRREEIITHPANEAIANKNPDNDKSFSTFDYDIIKDRRFTVDKFQFHVPVTMNFKARGVGKINIDVNLALKYGETPYVIGINRGERHLLYIVVINSKGEIVEQFSLNTVASVSEKKVNKTDYQKLLTLREAERDKDRKNWNDIESIKTLKEGYLSQVVHIISQLMIKYEAAVVLEDLDLGFKQSRQKVEKQVYQKFERRLIEKLNYLVDKSISPEKDGGLMNAYQLTGKFESFRKLGKQSGMLFYIPPWNINDIDPTTGFVNLFDTKYRSVEKCIEFWDAFEEIKYNDDEGYYEFSFDYSKFTHKAEGTRTMWTVCSYGDRVRPSTNKDGTWGQEIVRLTAEYNDIFSKYGININLLKESITAENRAVFHRELLRLFALTLKIRNRTDEVDYILSPVKNSEGIFFDSREAPSTLPENGSANGAYNIARKGLMAIEQIRATDDDNLGKVKFDISNKAWLMYVQG